MFLGSKESRLFRRQYSGYLGEVENLERRRGIYHE